jgi:photosynthetic reaction center cytochrome c subunit
MFPMRFAISLLLLMLPLVAQPPQEGKKGGGGGGRAPHKNLKIIKDEEVGPMMRAFTLSLGVRCDYCHIQGNFASDENPKKETARMMITMAHDVNARFPDGKVHVSCYTCHRGKTMPETEIPAPAPAPQQ